jgi:ubiquinone/menaquinone biosynthesis C-methylase UbiE
MSDAETAQQVSTKEGYARWASTYDGETNALIVLEEEHAFPILDGLSFTNVLDVGAGTGRYTLNLARRGAHVTAFDQSPEMLAVARQTAQQEGLSVDFQSGSLDNGLPFPADQFDLLTCALMLCHVPDLANAAQEFHRVLQPGGHLLVTDFHPDSVAYGWHTAFRQSGTIYQLPNMPHTRETYLDALTANGFTLVKVIDLPLRALPPRDYPPPLDEEFIQAHGETLFCLIILAQK